MLFTESPVLLVRRVVSVMFLVGITMFAAAPASADHLSGCVDTSGAEIDDHMTNDTAIACPDSGGPIPAGGGGGEGGTGDETGGVPTRIDAGGGGAAAATNPLAVGAGLTGAASAGVAWLAALRRRRG